MGASHDRGVATLWPVEANRLMMGKLAASSLTSLRTFILVLSIKTSGVVFWQWGKFVVGCFFLLSEAGCWISQKDVVE